LKQSLRNALRLAGRGEFRTLARKLYGGLLYRGRMSALPEESPTEVEETRQHLAFAPAGIPLNPGGKALRIVYVLRSAGLCGGVKVVLEHASRLYARGYDVSVFYLEGNATWFPWRVPTRRFGSVTALRRALKEFCGIKVATWYETAPWVAASLKKGDRGYYLVQDIEESYGDTAEQAAAALRTYSLGLGPITEGLWVRRQLKERFGLDSLFVSIGLDHQRYGPQLVLREPQRILTQSRTWSGGVSAGTRIKGWDTAREAILRCHAANPRTTLTSFSIEEAQSFPSELAHVHYQAPSDETLAQLYGQAGIYLLTSRHEGFGLTAAEAMACGCPVVATQAHGNEEFCIDGVTALTAPVGDAETLAQHCLRLQNDPAFARQLGKAGQDFIRQYTWDRVIDRLEREFLEREGPEVMIETPRIEATEDATPPSLAAPTPVVSGQHGGEYPDLRLRGSSFVDWSIVIPTLGKPDLVAACVSSCRRFIPQGVSVQFIVVDDGSSDPAIVQGLRAAAREHDFQLLFNHQNLGFSASVNRGMRRARGRYVVLCNNDVVFHQPWLEPLEQLFQRDPQVGIAGARLLYPDGTIQHAGMDKAKGSLSWFHAHGKQPADTPEARQTRYVWSVTGALFAVRRSVLERLGGLSTAYATAYEDLDYCLHAWANGVRVAYAADVCAYHLEGHTRGATEAEKRHRPIWAERERAGRTYFEKKWAFLRHIEDFRALLSLAERGTEFPVFAEEHEAAVA
jgi:GT2 family glycosyltransferase/glycosyltransferase involved in cell wall biosynthesis